VTDRETTEAMRAETQAIERFQAAQAQRVADYHWKAVIAGEAFAQEWLSQQPPFGLDGGEPTP
jgi:hypothetical protein